jgi:mRNA interferase RelE/StbE
MTYELGFLDEALKEWRKLDGSIREQFKSKLMQRLLHPRQAAAQLRGSKDRYKIKLKSLGYRLVYEVKDRELLVVVIAVGKRERSEVYKTAHFR